MERQRQPLDREVTLVWFFIVIFCLLVWAALIGALAELVS